ncbi:MAG TPA: hypothetical protein VNW90_16865 [Acetobacteraceae bacterium]|nr:hypothetical protein [Acetobacteraceae bacterium]
MFSVGQMVYHRSGRHSGKVLECDGDTVYLVQANGVESDFRCGELTAIPPRESSPAPAAASLSRVLTLDDVTPEHRRVLAVIPQRTIQSVALLFERQPNSGRFSALDVAQKLNFIAEVTGVPYRTMREFSDRPGILGLMMGRGLSVSLGSPT